MKILFLDDDYNRHSYFRSETVGHDVTHVKTAPQAIKTLAKEGPFDVACLDHDLDLQQRVANPGNGCDVARWIADNPQTVKRVLVHSWNSLGAARMVSVLARKVPVCREEFGPGLIALLAALR